MTSATLLLARARRVLPRPRVGGRRRRPPRVVVRSAAKKADGTIEDRLSLLHPYVAGGAAFMTAWVLGPFPGSLYTGIPSHDALVASLYDALHLAEVFGPSSLITKYNELGRLPAVRLLPIRPRSRGARRSLRTFPVVTRHPRFPFTV